MRNAHLFLTVLQELSDSHNDAAGIQLPHHLPALHDETGKSGLKHSDAVAMATTVTGQSQILRSNSEKLLG